MYQKVITEDTEYKMMKLFPRLSHFFLFAYLLSLSQAQGQDDACWSCPLGEAVKGGLDFLIDDAIVPAVGILQNLWPYDDTAPVPGKTDPAQGFVDVPQTDPKEQTTTNPGSNNLPGQWKSPAPDIEIIVNPADDEKCGHNDASALSQPDNCAVATKQIVWPSPYSCGDRTQTDRILTALNELAPPGGVRPFKNECGTFFFTASLTPPQIQQLHAKNIGIENIVPDEEMKLVVARAPLIQRRDSPFVLVEENKPKHLAYISTPPFYDNHDNSYARVERSGAGITTYWIDAQLFPDRELGWRGDNRLTAEDYESGGDSPDKDHGGCMLSLIAGDDNGVAGTETSLKIVLVNLQTSSFLSGLQAIITQLNGKIKQGVVVKGWNVVGTALTSPESIRGIFNQLKGTGLVKKLIYDYQVVFVVAAGDISTSPKREWPASIAKDPKIPIIVAGAVDTKTHLVASYSPSGPLVSLYAPGKGLCTWGTDTVVVEGGSTATAIITGLVVEMLSRSKVRNWLYLDRPESAPQREQNLAKRPVAAKIRDYLGEKSYNRLDPAAETVGGVKSIWNGLRPDNPYFYEP